MVSERISPNEYYRVLSETKIFISPHGYGEWSLKDFECICYGAHVVIPTGNIISYPNYYENFDNFDNNLDKLEPLLIGLLKDLESIQTKVDKNRHLFLSYRKHRPLDKLEQLLSPYCLK